MSEYANDRNCPKCIWHSETNGCWLWDCDQISRREAKVIVREWREAKGRWIPVTERLPEHEYGESASVLTVDLYGVMRVTYFDGGNWCWPSGEALTTTRVAPITHWMPLPEPPEEET